MDVNYPVGQRRGEWKVIHELWRLTETAIYESAAGLTPRTVEWVIELVDSALTRCRDFFLDDEHPSERLQLLCEYIGVSPSRLAAKARLDMDRIESFWTSDHQPGLYEVEILANALDVPAEVLLVDPDIRLTRTRLRAADIMVRFDCRDWANELYARVLPEGLPFGEALYRARSMRGMTRRAVAEAAGFRNFDVVMIQEIESGWWSVVPTTQMKLARAMRMSPSIFVDCREVDLHSEVQ